MRLYTVLSPLRYGGETIRPGAVLEIDAAAAAPLLKCGVLAETKSSVSGPTPSPETLGAPGSAPSPGAPVKPRQRKTKAAKVK